jgi:hypothetical protein
MSEALIGSWKLMSWQVMVDGEPRDLFGAKPKGSLILTRDGRATSQPCRARWREFLLVVQPETVLRWHRRGWTAYWRWGRSASPAPGLDPEILLPPH